jgi:integrase
MASIRKRGDSYLAEVYLKGVRKSKSHPTKAKAQAWATHIEAEILSGRFTTESDKTFSDLLDEYANRVSPTKAGAKSELVRIKLIQRDEIAKVKLSDLNQSHFAEWRERRLKQISGASVRREMNLLSGACKYALHEWKWLKFHPMEGVARPAHAPPRDKLISDQELNALQFALGYVGGIPETKSQRVALAFEFACETAMRAQEICLLKRAHVVGKTARILKSKTRAGIRTAPLTPRAIEIIDLLPTDDLFDLTPTIIDALFRKAKARLGITDITFHDSRHRGITILARKLPILALARSIGHQDLKQLMVYYNETPEAIADLL